MSDAAISLAVLGVAVVLFVWNRLPAEIVAVGAALALYATGVLAADQVFAGFGDATIIFIAGLFVVSEGLDASGVTTWSGQRLIAHAGGSRSLMLVATMGLFALVGAVITATGAIAALMPVAIVIALRLRRSPSSLLMPLAFVASAGSLLALTGSPVNVIVSEAESAPAWVASASWRSRPSGSRSSSDRSGWRCCSEAASSPSAAPGRSPPT